MYSFLLTKDMHVRTRVNKISPVPCIVALSEDALYQNLQTKQDSTSNIIIIDARLELNLISLLHKLSTDYPASRIAVLFKHAEGTALLYPFHDYSRHLVSMTLHEVMYGHHLQDFFSQSKDGDTHNLCTQPTVRYPHNKTAATISALIGSSPLMEKVRQDILLFAPLPDPVHIHGESGSGKEICANLLHEYSQKQGSLVSINCAQMQGSLVDAQLFGWEKGSFTGAVKSEQGIFEAAHRGCIFFDELQELPLSTQAELLRVLETKKYSRLGSTQQEYSSFRFISASHMSLEELLEQKRLRNDLYYRITGCHLHIPPLRRHPEDIPELCHFFFRRRTTEMKDLRPGDMEKLMAYSWPGNVRQLFSVLRQAQIYSHGKDTISIPDSVLV